MTTQEPTAVDGIVTFVVPEDGRDLLLHEVECQCGISLGRVHSETSNPVTLGGLDEMAAIAASFRPVMEALRGSTSRVELPRALAEELREDFYETGGAMISEPGAWNYDDPRTRGKLMLAVAERLDQALAA